MAILTGRRLVTIVCVSALATATAAIFAAPAATLCGLLSAPAVVTAAATTATTLQLPPLPQPPPLCSHRRRHSRHCSAPTVEASAIKAY